MVVRGYEGEARDRAVTADMIELRVKRLRRDNSSLAEEGAKKLAERQLNEEGKLVETLSCQGCHLGVKDSTQAWFVNFNGPGTTGHSAKTSVGSVRCVR